MADQEQVITNVFQAQALVNSAAEQADPPDVVNEAAPPDVPPPLAPHAPRQWSCGMLSDYISNYFSLSAVLSSSDSYRALYFA
jgi:hypothetical protein